MLFHYTHVGYDIRDWRVGLSFGFCILLSAIAGLGVGDGYQPEERPRARVVSAYYYFNDLNKT